MTAHAAAQLSRLTRWLPAAVCVAVAIVGWLGFLAVQRADRNARRLAQRTAQEAADFLASALMRDMRAAQHEVLSSHDWTAFVPERAHALAALVGSAFARYPYPESFFAWRATSAHPVVFFSRPDRTPLWISRHPRNYGSPVLITSQETIGRHLIARVTSDALLGRRASVFDTTIDEERYQVVASLRYRDPYREDLEAVVGFIVNLEWIDRTYFDDMTAELGAFAGATHGVALAITEGARPRSDLSGRLVECEAVAVRRFPVLFIDPVSLPLSAPSDLARETRAAEATLCADYPFIAWPSVSRGTLILATFATVLMGLGLVVTARAMRDSASLAETRSSFVAAVTHELKTPIATIRAAGDTLVSGRVASPEALQDYARLVVDESKRLTRLLNNLLAYSRLTDITDAYSFQPLDLQRVVYDALHDSRWRLESGPFRVEVSIAPDLPLIRGDLTSLMLMFDNVLDNAIRYSADERIIEISVTATTSTVTVDVADRGTGISPEDLKYVTHKFFRGRNASSGGSGLGLSIVERIVKDHEGALLVQSTVGAGTTVSMRFPINGGGHEAAHFDRGGRFWPG